MKPNGGGGGNYEWTGISDKGLDQHQVQAAVMESVC
jgi:hypothetical protein